MFKFELSESDKQFALLRTANKITFEFGINLKEKDRFLYLVGVLSVVEFMVDVDLNGIQIKKYNNPVFGDRVLFRVKASGKEEDLNRWNDNLCCVAKFLRGEYDITYIKEVGEKEQDNI